MAFMSDLTKRRFFAATIAALILAAALAHQAEAALVCYLNVSVRPAGAGDVLVDGVAAPYYPYTYTFGFSEQHNFNAVAKPRNPALVLPGELPTHFYWRVWRGTYGGNQNQNLLITQSGALIAEFASYMGIVKGKVWQDTNKNGLMDEGEPGLPGWTVQMRNAATGDVVSQDQTYSAGYTYEAGAYMLAAQEPGNYYLTFELKAGYIASARHVGGDVNVWSEPYPNPYPSAPAPGQQPQSSAVFQLAVGGNDVVMNAGCYKYGKNVTPDAAKTISEENRNMIFLDVRESAEVDAKHIPACIENYPLNSGFLAANVDQLKDAFGLGAKIVTVSNAGFRSTLAAKFLTEYGFTDVNNMVPGMDDWRWYTLSPGQAYPVSDAGPDAAVAEGTTHTLNGALSSNYGIFSYTWTQVSGPTVVLSDYNSLMPTFFAPGIAANTNAVFRLRVESFCLSAPVVTSDVTINLTDNGIVKYAADVTPFWSFNDHPIGVKVEGGTVVRLAAADPAIYTETVSRPTGMPYGIFDWAVRTDELGGTAKVTFHFPDEQLWYNTWVKYNKTTGQWSNYGDHAVWDQTLKKLTITVVDGGIGDEDREANWIVADPGGLGYYAADVVDTPAIISDDLGTSRGDDSGTARGCFISALGF